jgi:cytochrome c
MQDPSVHEYEATRDLVEVVNDAARQVSERGTAALDDFAQGTGRWRRGERYLLVFDTNGVCLFNPVSPGHVGKNLIEFKDVLGKPVVRWLVGIAENRARPYGWIHYLSPPPQSLYPMWKSTYAVAVTAPDGGRYVIGSGLYNTHPERQFIIDLVDRAVELIQRQGAEAAFPLLQAESSEFNLMGVYVYVLTPEGDLLVDPAYPAEPRRGAIQFRDAVGRNFIRDAIERLQQDDRAQVYFMWFKPGEATPSKKLMYLRRVEVDGETYLVGSDLFLSRPIWLHF